MQVLQCKSCEEKVWNKWINKGYVQLIALLFINSFLFWCIPLTCRMLYYFGKLADLMLVQYIVIQNVLKWRYASKYCPYE